MKKLNLALADLAVESFAPAELSEESGTVHAQEVLTYAPAYTCWGGTCHYPECTKPGALC